MSTKIVSLGRIEMCEETLEGIELAILAGQALKEYSQKAPFYTGTGSVINNEDGWDAGYWVPYLKDSSYEDPRDVFLYLLHKTTPPCSPVDMFHGGGSSGYPCHEYELKDDPFFYIKEVSKIYTDIELSPGTPPFFTDQDEFNPQGTITNPLPYSDLMDTAAPPNAPGPAFGGFVVDRVIASRFSPCGGGGVNPQNCIGKPGDNWTNNPAQSVDLSLIHI